MVTHEGRKWRLRRASRAAHSIMNNEDFNKNLCTRTKNWSVKNNSKCVGTRQSYGAFQSQNPRNVPRNLETPRANLGTPATDASDN
jgi:hypothetical protein